MTLSLMANLVTIFLCIGVIVQATRMMRQLAAVKDSELATVVTGLDQATARAAEVLADIKGSLGRDGAALAQSLAEGQELREELTMLIGIADAMAERLVEAGRNPKAGPVIEGKAARAPRRPRKGAAASTTAKSARSRTKSAPPARDETSPETEVVSRLLASLGEAQPLFEDASAPARTRKAAA